MSPPLLPQDITMTSETEVSARARDLSNRLRGRYAKGPIMDNGEPEFGYAVFTEMPDGRPFPGLYSEAADMIDTLAALSRAPGSSNAGDA